MQLPVSILATWLVVNQYTNGWEIDGYKMPLVTMMELIKFSMDNAICKLNGECFLRQTTGIPQGDSLSPAMCIGTCGWYEMQWMARWNPEQKQLFHMRRYLDDVHMTFNKSSIEAQEIVNNFKERGACYPEALSLEGEDDNIFGNKHHLW